MLLYWKTIYSKICIAIFSKIFLNHLILLKITIAGFGKQRLLDVQHENKCSDSTQTFSEKTTTEIWYDRRKENLQAFIELEINNFKIFIQKENDKS